MPKVSSETRIVDNIVEELDDFRKAAEAARPIPFGEEELSPRDARNRLRKMAPEQIRKLVKERGLDYVMRIVGPSTEG